ncbi:MAG: hypothetical protein PHR73_04215, partial [Candidatus Omnitrophica bacterium]|nr:hypothetical protein [Candidatus Omnitrophota bacterium]
LSPEQYYLFAGLLSDIEHKHSVMDNRNIRFAINFIFDLWETEKRILEQAYLIAQMDKELNEPGSGRLPLVAAMQDLHGGAKRALSLIGFILGLAPDIYIHINNVNDLKELLLEHGIDIKESAVRFVGLNDKYDRGNDPAGVFELVRWLRQEGGVKPFIGSHDFWRAMAVLGVHLLFEKRGIDYKAIEIKNHHIAYWAHDIFRHAGWSDVELDQLNQARFNRNLKAINTMLELCGLGVFKYIDLLAQRAGYEKEIKEIKKYNAKIRSQNEANKDVSGYKRKGERPLPDILDEVLKYLRQCKANYNKAIKFLNEKYDIDLPLIEFNEVNLDNFWRDPEIIERALWELKNFRLFYVDVLGNLHMHSIVPVDYQDGGFAVEYKGLKGLSALELMAEDVRLFFQGMQSIPDSMVFRKKMWEQLGEAFTIINGWYSDIDAYAKPVSVKKFIDKGGLKGLGKGIIGQIPGVFVDRAPEGFVVWGHNERKKFGHEGVKLPWFYPHASLKSGILNIDDEMSEGYADRGGVLTFFMRTRAGEVTGLRRWGYRKGSQVIEDITFDDLDGLSDKGHQMLKMLAEGREFIRWYKDKLTNSICEEAGRLVAYSRQLGRPDKERFARSAIDSLLKPQGRARPILPVEATEHSDGECGIITMFDSVPEGNKNNYLLEETLLSMSGSKIPTTIIMVFIEPAISLICGNLGAQINGLHNDLNDTLIELLIQDKDEPFVISNISYEISLTAFSLGAEKGIKLEIIFRQESLSKADWHRLKLNEAIAQEFGINNFSTLAARVYRVKHNATRNKPIFGDMGGRGLEMCAELLSRVPGTLVYKKNSSGPYALETKLSLYHITSSSPVEDSYKERLNYIAGVAIYEKNYLLALECLKKLILWDPQDIKPVLDYLEVAEKSQDLFTLAFQKAKEIIDEIDLCPVGYHLRSVFYLKMRKFKNGLEDLNSAIRLSHSPRDKAYYLFEKAAYLDNFIQSGKLYSQGFDITRELNNTVSKLSQYDSILRQYVTPNWEFLAYVFLAQSLVSKNEYQCAEHLLTAFFQKSGLMNMQEGRYPLNQYIARAFDLRASIRLINIEKRLIGTELNWISGLAIEGEIPGLKALFAAASNDMKDSFARGGSYLHGRNCLTYINLYNKLLMIEQEDYEQGIYRISFRKSLGELHQAIARILLSKGGRRFNLRQLREAKVYIDPGDIEILKAIKVISTIQDLPETYYYGDMSVFVVAFPQPKISFSASSPIAVASGQVALSAKGKDVSSPVELKGRSYRKTLHRISHNGRRARHFQWGLTSEKQLLFFIYISMCFLGIVVLALAQALFSGVPLLIVFMLPFQLTAAFLDTVLIQPIKLLIQFMDTPLHWAVFSIFMAAVSALLIRYLHGIKSLVLGVAGWLAEFILLLWPRRVLPTYLNRLRRAVLFTAIFGCSFVFIAAGANTIKNSFLWYLGKYTGMFVSSGDAHLVSFRAPGTLRKTECSGPESVDHNLDIDWEWDNGVSLSGYIVIRGKSSRKSLQDGSRRPYDTGFEFHEYVLIPERIGSGYPFAYGKVGNNNRRFNAVNSYGEAGRFTIDYVDPVTGKRQHSAGTTNKFGRQDVERNDVYEIKDVLVSGSSSPAGRVFLTGRLNRLAAEKKHGSLLEEASAIRVSVQSYAQGLLRALGNNNIRLGGAFLYAIPKVEEATKDKPAKWFKIAMQLGVGLINEEGVLPCPVLALGIPLAVDFSAGSFDKYMFNVACLKSWAIEVNEAKRAEMFKQYSASWNNPSSGAVEQVLRKEVYMRMSNLLSGIKNNPAYRHEDFKKALEDSLSFAPSSPADALQANPLRLGGEILNLPNIKVSGDFIILRRIEERWIAEAWRQLFYNITFQNRLIQDNYIVIVLDYGLKDIRVEKIETRWGRLPGGGPSIKTRRWSRFIQPYPGVGSTIIDFLRQDALQSGWSVSFTGLKDANGDWLRKLIRKNFKDIKVLFPFQSFYGYDSVLPSWDGNELGARVVGWPKHGQEISGPVSGASFPVEGNMQSRIYSGIVPEYKVVVFSNKAAGKTMVELPVARAKSLDAAMKLSGAQSFNRWLSFEGTPGPEHVPDIIAYRDFLKGLAEEQDELYLALSFNNGALEVEGWVDLNISLAGAQKNASYAVMEISPWNRLIDLDARRFLGLGHELRVFGIKKLLQDDPDLRKKPTLTKIRTLGHRDMRWDIFDDGVTAWSVEEYLVNQQIKRDEFIARYGFCSSPVYNRYAFTDKITGAIVATWSSSSPVKLEIKDRVLRDIIRILEKTEFKDKYRFLFFGGLVRDLAAGRPIANKDIDFIIPMEINDSDKRFISRSKAPAPRMRFRQQEELFG